MMLSKRMIKPRVSRRGNLVRSSDLTVQALEGRRLFSGEYIANAIAPILANTASPASNAITLNQHFNDTTLPGTLVTFNTTEGEIQVGLTDAATPQTVANFLNYVDSGAYNYTFFHRSVDLNDGADASPSDPGTIIQGGGYNISNNQISAIPTNAPVPDEYTTELYGDVAGTIAMAKTSAANSATSQFYFNVTDNTELDTPTTDPTDPSVMTSYTVFGQVLSGTNVISTIAALPTTSLGGDLSAVPVTGLTEAQIQAGDQPSGNNLIFVESVTAQPGTNYTVTSSNAALVTPTVNNGVLSFTYGPGFGTADVTITGTNLDGTSASTNVVVTVPNPAAPGSGVSVVNTTAAGTVTGTTGLIDVLGGDTDSVAPLDPSTVTIVTPPAHGTASVNTSTGQIAYTPNAGYVGPDSLTYTVADTEANVSAPATVTLDAVPEPLQVTIGAGGVNSLVFTQPNGFSGTLTVLHGTALVTFTSYQVSTSELRGVLHASGSGCTITSVDVTNTGLNSVLNVKATGPIALGSVNCNARLLELNAPEATLSGTCTITGGCNHMAVASISDSTLILGRSGVEFNLVAPNVTDTNIVDQQVIQSINSTNWINDNNGDYSITAPAIEVLNATGVFQEVLNLDPATYGLNRYALFDANIAQPAANWNISGSVYRTVITGTPSTDWSLSVAGSVGTLIVKGNLDNTIQVGAISTMLVYGTTTNSTIETSDAYSKKYTDLRSLIFRGAVSNTVVYSTGNITSITAPSLLNSRIYAGVQLTTAEDGVLAASASDISADAKISSVTLTASLATAFSESLISADLIGTLRLGHINTSDSGVAEGVSATSIGAVSGVLVPGGIFAPSGANLKTAAALTAYETKKKLALGDFSVDLF